MTRALLEQARDALTHIETCIHGHDELRLETIYAIRAHLAQPQGEPVAWINPAGTYAEASTSSTVYGSHTIPLYIHPAHTEGPAWHDAPNAPGLWVVGSRCLQINELDLPIYERSNCRWFGPVPDDGGKP